MALLRVLSGFLAVGLLLVAEAAQGEEWATLRGRFLFEGEAPKPKKLAIDKDRETCGKRELVDESLVVDPKTKGIANIVVQLRAEKPPVHPRIRLPPKAVVEIETKHCRFEPHISIALVGQRVATTNTDVVGHNPIASFKENPPWPGVIPPGDYTAHVLKVEETIPARLSCAIHPWMSGYLVVSPHPYVTKTATDGSFEIPDLPPGEWTFRVWHERSGHVEEVTYEGEKWNWKRGRFTIKIKPGENDLGDVSIPAKDFEF